MFAQGLKRLKKVEPGRSGHNSASECLKTGKEERYVKGSNNTSISFKYKKMGNEGVSKHGFNKQRERPFLETCPKRLKVKGPSITGSFEYNQIS